jgi:hypothetical protein
MIAPTLVKDVRPYIVVCFVRDIDLSGRYIFVYVRPILSWWWAGWIHTYGLWGNYPSRDVLRKSFKRLYIHQCSRSLTF